MKYRIQIITAITGREREARAEAALVTKALRAAGHFVVNPFEICAHIDTAPMPTQTASSLQAFQCEEMPVTPKPRLYKDAYWHECMKECLESICYNNIDLVLAISDISNSIGAHIELLTAHKFNITTYERHSGAAFLPFFGCATIVTQVLEALTGAGVWEPIKA